MKFYGLCALLLCLLAVGCASEADTSATVSGVDDSVVQTEEQMKAMEAQYEAEMQSQ